MPNISSIVRNVRNIMRQDRGVSGDAQRLEQLGWMLFLKILDEILYPFGQVDTVVGNTGDIPIGRILLNTYADDKQPISAATNNMGPT